MLIVVTLLTVAFRWHGLAPGNTLTPPTQEFVVVLAQPWLALELRKCICNW